MNKINHKILIEVIESEMFIDDKLDIILETLDEWLTIKDYQTVNNFLSQMPSEKTDLNCLIGIFTVIHGASKELTSYSNFEKRVQKFVEKNHTLEESEHILDGLISSHIELNDEVVKSLDPSKKYIFSNKMEDAFYGYYKCKIDGFYRIECGQNHEWVTHVKIK